MKKYSVVVHYEGAWIYDVEAQNEDEAKQIAENMFADADQIDVWSNVDWEACDCWEEK